MRMVVRVRRTVRSGIKGSAWQGNRKLSMRGMAKDPFGANEEIARIVVLLSTYRIEAES